MLRRILIVLALLTGGLVLGNAPAHACSCAPLTSAERMEHAAVVFTGTVTRLDAPFEPFSPDVPNVFTFHVDHAYKGAPTAALEVASHTQGPACGMRFEPGSRWLIFARSENGELESGLCSGNVPIAKGGKPLTANDLPTGESAALIAALGPARQVAVSPPEPAVVSRRLPPVLVIGVIGVAGLIALVSWGTFRRSRSRRTR
ncbi:hypothetical protein FDA94_08785 [Herbidospora galbida]|uniref:Tissue inhibitor of metalloproteinase n=1 Tax=Herbidospora galbida TaxID=2575442 RepID=A0A4U3MJF0_9ACTN|nr:hypothetical protein [Herbidospora galbida]TKK89481.1 hypothetical protein FDA94_08785 [Herbidospora galbida]